MLSHRLLDVLPVRRKVVPRGAQVGSIQVRVTVQESAIRHSQSLVLYEKPDGNASVANACIAAHYALRTANGCYIAALVRLIQDGCNGFPQKLIFGPSRPAGQFL